MNKFSKVLLKYLNQKSLKAIILYTSKNNSRAMFALLLLKTSLGANTPTVPTLWKGAFLWEQTCSFVSLVLKPSAVAVFIAMILTSFEFSTCSHCSKFLRSWKKSSWLPPASWSRFACWDAQHSMVKVSEAKTAH